jgi:hypothetical protein
MNESGNIAAMYRVAGVKRISRKAMQLVMK